MIDIALEKNTPPSVGQILKAARLEHDITLEQVSTILCIPKRQLAYLEEDADHLVCDVYTLGFVKLYAQYLELDAQKLMEKFKDQAIPDPKSSQLVFPAPLPGRGMPSFRILALSLFALVVIILGWKWGNTYTPTPIPHPEITLNKDEEITIIKEEEVVVNKGEEIIEIKTEEPVRLPAEQPTLLDPPRTEDIVPVEAIHSDLESLPQAVHLQVTEKAWIEVKDIEGNIIVSRIFQPGESYKFENSENLILKTGNLKGTHLASGERIFPVSAKSGEIGRDIPLNPKKWLEQQPESY